LTPQLIALDVGGTKIEAGAVSDNGRVVRHTTVPSHEGCALDVLLADIASAVDPLRSPGIGGLGVGFPALGDYERGTLDGERSLFRCVAGFPLSDHLAGQFGVPVRMTTDANVFALGVHAFGEARGFRDVVALTLGTGVGIGVIHAGRLYAGPRGIPDETLQALAGVDSHLGAAGHHFQRLYGVDGVILSRRAQDGDRAALDAFRSIGSGVAAVILQLVAIFADTQLVVLGGGVSQSWRFFAAQTRSELSRAGVHIPLVRTRLRHPALVGAAALFAYDVSSP
jgi:glucokinase